jgi:hypothetical protein
MQQRVFLWFTSAEIPPKTRYKQKQNEIHYENSTHFIRLTLSKVETPPLDAMRYCGHHVSDMVYESADKDGFSKIGS